MKKNIYIIGGNGLIGSDFINSYINLNHRVINLDIKHTSLKKKKNLKNVIFDCSDLESISKKLSDIFRIYGDPHILINASYPVTNDWKKNTFENVSYNNFKKNIEIHLNSYCWITKIFADKMKSKKIPGRIVLLSSIYGLVGQNESNYKNTSMNMNFTYPIIKSGIIGFVKQAASYYGKYKINVNALCPGSIIGHVKGSKKKQSKKFIKKISENIPLRRLANVSEISSVINFLISKESNYVTGQSIVVDGGYTVI